MAMRMPGHHVAALAVLLLAAGGCAAPTANGVETPPEVSPTPPTATTVVVDTVPPPTAVAPTMAGVTVTYTDAETGITLDYPAGWSLTEPAPEIKATSQTYSTTFSSWAPGPGGQAGIPPGGAKFDLTVVKEGPTDLDAFAGAHPEWTPPDAARVVLRSGRPAIRLELADTQGGPGPTVQWLAVIDGQPLILSGVGDLALVDAVAQSLRMAP